MYKKIKLPLGKLIYSLEICVKFLFIEYKGRSNLKIQKIRIDRNSGKIARM